MARVTVLTEEHFHSSHLNVRERLLPKLYAEFKQKVAEISFRPLCRARTEISKDGDCAQPGSICSKGKPTSRRDRGYVLTAHGYIQGDERLFFDSPSGEAMTNSFFVAYDPISRAPYSMSWISGLCPILGRTIPRFRMPTLN